jgi:hypothetical protein
VTVPATHLWGGFEVHKMVHVPPSKKRKVQHQESVEYAQHINEKKPVLCVRVVVWHFTKLLVLVLTT